MRERASQPEKFFIELLYDRQVTGNLEREGQTAAMWTETYPRDAMAHGLWAGYATEGTGKYEKSIEEAEITIGLDPGQVYAYTAIAGANLHLGRFPESEKALMRAAANHMDMSHPGFCTHRFYLAFLKNDQALVKFSVNDILNDNNGYTRYLNGSNVYESNRLVIKRYWLLTLTWNFTKSIK